jgi:carboxymethylenebutenolidase
MKKIYLLLLSALSATLSFGQTHSCCSISSSEQFARLSNDPVFTASHLAPIPFRYVSEKGKMITYKTKDGRDVNAFEVMADKPTDNCVLMIHEWWGLNGYIKQEAEKLQKELGNVNVYALDLYDGKVADNAQDAGRYMGEVKEDRARAIIQGAIDRAGKKAKIYTIGWCFGGGWSLQASLMAGKQGRGCVMYYGMPESDLAKLKKLNADVLGIFAEKDAWITPAVVATFEKNMKDAGKKITVKSYDADHAFANPSNPKYSKEFAEDAHQRALAFFREHLK